MASSVIIRPIGQSRRLANVSFVLFVASMVTNISNYAVQVALGRILGPVDYGLFNALLSLTTVLSIPVGTLILVVNKKVSECYANNLMDAISALYRRTLFKSIVFGVLLAFLVAFSGPWLADFLNVSYGAAIFWLAPVVMVIPMQQLNIAFSQGLQDFLWVAIGTATAGPLRLITTLSAALLGWGVSGTIGAVFLASAIGWSLTTHPLRKLLENRKKYLYQKAGHLYWTEISPVFLSVIAFTVITQADIVVVKARFSPEAAGIFAAAAMIGKAVMHIPSAIVLGLMPMVANETSLQRNTSGLLKTALLLTLLFSLCGALILFIIPEWIILSFFGEQYIQSVPFLKFYGIVMIPIGLLLVIKIYLIARGLYTFLYILLAGAFFMLGLWSAWCSNAMEIIFVIGTCGTLIAFIGLFICFYTAKLVPYKV